MKKSESHSCCSVSGRLAAQVTPLSPGGEHLLGTLGHESGRSKLSFGLATLVFVWGIVAYIQQLRHGLAVTAMTDYFSWGIYIVNFVFFIGISMAGSLISAILRLTGAGWRHPITRMAEGVTVFALVAAALLIVVDMGRPDRFLHILLYGRLQSPILWDVFSLSTYLTGSLLFLYLPLIPDLAILRDQGARFSRWRQRLYRWLALGWSGTPEQHRRLDRAVMAMSIVIIPVAVSIHTVTAWLFGMTLRPGWHSTIIGPDFVVGALYSGVAAVITVMAVARWKFRLHGFVKEEHFRKLGWLLLVLCIAYAYFMVNEYAGAIFTHEESEAKLVQAVFHGAYATQFWTMTAIGLGVPALLLALPWTRTARGIVAASIFVNVGMWIKRFIIVVPTLSSPFLPVELPAGKVFAYIPTWVEWSITAGAFAGFYLFYCLFAKLVPIVSIWETEEAHHAPAPLQAPTSVGKHAASASASAVIVLFVALSVMPRGARAAESNPATLPTKPAISLSKSTEDGKPTLTAAVLLAGKPVEGAKIAFTVKRTFGRLLIGEDVTLDDGTAAAAFPSDLAGGPSGELLVRAEIKSPATYAGVSTEATFSGALVFKAESAPFPRAMWAPRAPVSLVLALLILLGTVWGIYAWVVLQIVQIQRHPTAHET